MNTQISEDRTTYYYMNGERHSLVREPRIFALRPQAGKSIGEINASKMLPEDSEPVEFLPQYGLQIYVRGNLPPQNNEPNGADDGMSQKEVRDIADLEDESVIDFAAVAYRRSPMGANVPAVVPPTGAAPNKAERQNIPEVMFANRQFLARFKSDVSQEAIDAFNARYDVRIIEPLGYSENGYLLEASKAEGEMGAVALANHYFESGMVLWAHPNFIQKRHLRSAPAAPPTETMGTPPAGEASRAKTMEGEGYEWSDKAQPIARQNEAIERTLFLTNQWHLRTAKVEDAWTITRGSSNIVVAVMDDGIDVAHPEFSGRVVRQFDFASNTSNATPQNASDRHGTACAGVAVAGGSKAAGAAPGCGLLAIRTASFWDFVTQARTFQWASDQGADVISCSWGPPDGQGTNDPLPDNVRDSMDYCVDRGRNGKGIPIFFAAGNGNESVMLDGWASYDGVIAVAASTSNERRAWYSDTGPAVDISAPSSGSSAAGELRIFTADRRGNAGYNPDPQDGTANPATDLDYTATFGGTSSSTPLVAGIAGLMLSVNANLTRNDVKSILEQTADKIDTANGNYINGHSNMYGYGRVNALRAVQEAQRRAGGSSGSGSGAGSPSISGPSQMSPSDSAPTFTINKGGRHLYAVEVATQAELFNNATHGGQRNDNNFYGSWTVELLSSTPFQLPTDVWQRLKNGTRLYYRLHVADNSEWGNYDVTVADEQASIAPSIELTRSTGGSTGGGTTGGGPVGGSVPTISAPASINRTDAAPTFAINKGGRQLYAVEIANQAALFNNATHGGQRNDNNFYGSWAVELLSHTPFQLPNNVWQRLQNSTELFYRLHVADNNEWRNYDVTVADEAAQSAPRIQIIGSSSPTDPTNPSSGSGVGTGAGGSPRTVTYPSGISFTEVTNPVGSIDYSDPVGNNAVPLIDTQGRENEKLSNNFQVKELAGRNARYARISVQLVNGLQTMRERLGKSIVVNSGYRHRAHNQQVGGATSSQHIAGRAADIRSSGVKPIDMAKLALEAFGCDIGLGLGKNIIHVDVRGRRASWVYDGAEMNEREFDDWVAEQCQALGRSVKPRMEPRTQPTILGPDSYSRGNQPPTFNIQLLDTHPYFAVEFATDPKLFSTSAENQRSSGNFYASWAVMGLRKGMPSSTYTMPKERWDELRGAARLYYRVVASAASSEWEDVSSSTNEPESVPFMEIVESSNRDVMKKKLPWLDEEIPLWTKQN